MFPQNPEYHVYHFCVFNVVVVASSIFVRTKWKNEKRNELIRMDHIYDYSPDDNVTHSICSQCCGCVWYIQQSHCNAKHSYEWIFRWLIAKDGK